MVGACVKTSELSIDSQTADDRAGEGEPCYQKQARPAATTCPLFWEPMRYEYSITIAVLASLPLPAALAPNVIG